ncbi:hypothetical protein QUF72_04905, partial [Desulfobacterales bacterium HSG2]|nr:hypothetical protein [Desulfobacterales bacterium HSG2]
DMDLKDFLKSGAFAQKTAEPGMFRELDATELYCPKCKVAVPVRKRLLLVLPEGDKYEYRCAFCAESVGTKIDR